MQRFIREVNTTNRACVLWDLAEDADYIIQVQSIGLYGESQASKRVHFRTLKETDRLPSNSSNQGEAAPSTSPRCCWWGHSWRSPQRMVRDPAASGEGAALSSRLLGRKGSQWVAGFMGCCCVPHGHDNDNTQALVYSPPIPGLGTLMS